MGQCLNVMPITRSKRSSVSLGGDEDPSSPLRLTYAHTRRSSLFTHSNNAVDRVTPLRTSISLDSPSGDNTRKSRGSSTVSNGRQRTTLTNLSVHGEVKAPETEAEKSTGNKASNDPSADFNLSKLSTASSASAESAEASNASILPDQQPPTYVAARKPSSDEVSIENDNTENKSPKQEAPTPKIEMTAASESVAARASEKRASKTGLTIPAADAKKQTELRKSEVKFMKLTPGDMRGDVNLFENDTPVPDKRLSSSPEFQNILRSEGKKFEDRYANVTEKGGKKEMFGKLEDFELHKVLGSGSFGLVILSKYRDKGMTTALKVLRKEQIVKQKQIEHVICEKQVLQAVDWPFLIKLHGSFKDNANLFLAMEFCNGGEMFTHLRHKEKFSEMRSRVYAAQVVLAFEYLHSRDILYRDLKPENILFDSLGFIKICDFGFAKRVRKRTYTLCGTPEYLAPEIILSRGYAKAVDWWSFGILVYEMAAGYPPFNPSTKIADPGRRYAKLYEDICDSRLRFPGHFTSELRHLVKHLLERDITRRYGNLRNGVNDIKEHMWFSGVHWLSVYQRDVKAPYVPKVKGPDDDRNFPGTDEPMKVAKSKIELYPVEFADF